MRVIFLGIILMLKKTSRSLNIIFPKPYQEIVDVASGNSRYNFPGFFGQVE